jgi:hypothetical protein
MARPLRIILPGALYHLATLGDARNDTNHDDATVVVVDNP